MPLAAKTPSLSLNYSSVQTTLFQMKLRKMSTAQWTGMPMASMENTPISSSKSGTQVQPLSMCRIGNYQ